jgi:hypothetical protein
MWLTSVSLLQHAGSKPDSSVTEALQLWYNKWYNSESCAETSLTMKPCTYVCSQPISACLLAHFYIDSNGFSVYLSCTSGKNRHLVAHIFTSILQKAPTLPN